MTEQLSRYFANFGGRVWLNASHQGPLPNVAVEAAHHALELKIRPFNVSTSQPFNDVPNTLRAALGTLLGAEPNDMILGNSASYGMHQLALGFDWSDGDEVLLVEGDFPATTFPFMLLRDRGVTVRYINPKQSALTPDELHRHLSERTRLFCTTWVHSFTGYALDIVELGEICHANGTEFAINASQAVGAISLDVSNAPVDAVIGCGFKWLCGPYGTGYAWFSQKLRDRMNRTKLYWLAHFTAEDLKKEILPGPRDDIGARAFDLFGTANFNNFLPWTASIELINSINVKTIYEHDQKLVSHFLNLVDREKYDILSPLKESQRSAIIIITHRDRNRNSAIFDTLRAEGIDNSLRRGNLRFAPHFYNSLDDIDRAINVLNAQ